MTFTEAATLDYTFRLTQGYMNYFFIVILESQTFKYISRHFGF